MTEMEEGEKCQERYQHYRSCGVSTAANIGNAVGTRLGIGERFSNTPDPSKLVLRLPNV